MLCTRFDWPRITAWSEYRCSQIAAFCVFLHRIATTSRLFDLEKSSKFSHRNSTRSFGSMLSCASNNTDKCLSLDQIFSDLGHQRTLQLSLDEDHPLTVPSASSNVRRLKFANQEIAQSTDKWCAQAINLCIIYHTKPFRLQAVSFRHVTAL